MNNLKDNRKMLMVFVILINLIWKTTGDMTTTVMENQQDNSTDTTVNSQDESDGEMTRKILGSSVVTSVSVIMDVGNGSQAVFSDAAGKPVQKPATASQLASPINLLNPDRYEFFTFDDKGDLVKRLMTLDEIQGILASGDGESASYNSQLLDNVPKKDVNAILNNVQNVLKKEIESHHSTSSVKPVYDTPDVSSTWSMILPAIFGNSGDEIQLKKPQGVVTPDTITLENNTFELPAQVKIENDITTSSPKITSTETEQPTTTDQLLKKLISTLSQEKTTETSSSTVTENLVKITEKSTTLKPEVEVPLIQVVISESDPDKDLNESQLALISQLSNIEQSSTNSNDVFTQLLSKESDSLLSDSNVNEVTTLQNVNLTNSKLEVTTDSSIKTRTTDTILLILSTIKKDLTTINPTTSMPIVSTITERVITTTDSQNLKTSPSTTTTTKKQENIKTSTVFYEPIKLLTLSTLSSLSALSSSKPTTQSSKIETTTKALPISTLKLTSESPELLLNPNDANSSNDELVITQGGLNDSNLIQAVDDLLSQIIGFNQTTIEYSSIMPEEYSRTEPTDFESNLTKTITNATSNIENFTASSNSNYTIQNLNLTSIGDVVNFDTNPQLSQYSLQTTKNYQTTTDELKELGISTTVLPTTIVDKEEELMDATETNNFKNNEISSSTSQINNFSEVTQSSSVSGKYTTEKEYTTSDIITSTLNDLYTTDTINKINSLSSSTIYEEDPYASTTVEQEKYEATTTNSKPVGGNHTYTILNLSSESTSPVNAFSAASTIEELLSPLFSNNVKYLGIPKKENDLVNEENIKNTTDTLLIITTLPVDKVDVSSSTAATLENKPTLNFSTENLKVENATTVIPASSTVSSAESSWKLISTIPSPKETATSTESKKVSAISATTYKPPTSVYLNPDSAQAYGLEETTAFLDTDVYRFTELCNELSFSLWSKMYKFVDATRSIFISPFATTSMLAMVFLGAKGTTSGEMNDILKLDDMVTFNPHAVFKNVSDTIEVSKESGIAASVILRELYSDRSKGKFLNFYKERVRHFYDGHVEEVNFTSISDVIRRRTNLLVKRFTWGKIHEFLKDNAITARPPLAAVTASIFQTDCSSTSTSGRDGELHFVFAPNSRQRKLVPIPAAVWQTGFLAGYDPSLDATAVSIGTTENTVSTIFVIPGQQGIAAPGDGLSRLEERLTKTAFAQSSWSRLIRSLIPRPGLEVQIPRFAHRSTINTTVALEQMGLNELFNPTKADLKGMNVNAHDMFLSDLLQVNYFVMCGEGKVGERHYFEEYPVTLEHTYRNDRELKDLSDKISFDDPKEFQRALEDSILDTSLLDVPLPLRPRQARLPDAPRLRFDRPFLYFVRHNPTGLILHMGRFNPRLL